MLISFTTTNSYTDSSLFKTLLTWRVQYLIIFFVLFCLLILFYWWKQCIQNLSVNKNLKQKLDNDHKQSFETLTVDTIRKIPLQTSASKRRMLVSKSLKKNKKKSSTVLSSRSNKSHRTAKTGQPINSSSTIKISLVVSKENIDQTLSNISLLTIHGIEYLNSKHISSPISITLPSTNLTHDISNKIENTSSNTNRLLMISERKSSQIEGKTSDFSVDIQ